MDFANEWLVGHDLAQALLAIHRHRGIPLPDDVWQIIIENWPSLIRTGEGPAVHVLT